MMDRIVMEVSRYRPEIESAPTFQAYEVPLTREWAVLDGLTYIKDHLDGTLSFRWSCRMGICGSSGMTINGDPKLACATFLADYLPGPVRVEPMRNFPVIRDLVVDISDFMAKLPSVKPWLVRHDEPPVEDGEYRQTPAELDAFKQFSMCINCMLCYSACPVYALDPDFLGPAAIALGQRYNLDSRDQGAADRRDVLAAADGAWACTLVGECSTACPKGVDPAGAIQRYKLTAATHALKKLLFPWGGADERLSPAGRKILVGEAAFLPAIHASRNQLHLRGLVCSLSGAGIARRWRGREFLPAVFGLQRQSGCRSAERRRVEFPAAACCYLVRIGTARDGDSGSRPPGTRSRGPCWALRGMAGGFGDRCLDGAVMTPSTSDARSRRRSAEPFLWLLFSAGGMVTALVAPVLLLLFGLAFPLRWLDAPDHGHLLAMVRNPITKLVVLVLVVLALFHAAHRFRFVLDHGLQLGRFDRVIALWCYGMAVLGSATAGWMLLTM